MHQKGRHGKGRTADQSGSADLRSNSIRRLSRALKPAELNVRLKLAPWENASPAIADLPDVGKTKVLALGMQEVVKASKLENPLGPDFPLAEFIAVKLEDESIRIVGQEMVQFMDPRIARANSTDSKLDSENVA